MITVFDSLRKAPTGLTGFDELALGGLPVGRTTVVSGTMGSGKSLFASEFLAKGIDQFDEPGVFVTFEEPPAHVRANLASFGYDIDRWEADDKWRFVDASGMPAEEETLAGSFDFGGLIARIGQAVSQLRATRVAIDSLGALFSRFHDPRLVRLEFRRLGLALAEMSVTTVLTTERQAVGDAVPRFGIEEFVSDNVIMLNNVVEVERRRRTIEILKFRGAAHRTGEWPFTIDPLLGMVILPPTPTGSKTLASAERVSTGLAELDAMCGGGLYRDTLAVVSGPPGTGKTLLATLFAGAPGERCLFLSFDATLGQLIRDATSWGIDMVAMEAAGRLHTICEYPELASLEEHLLRIRRAIEEYRPTRLVVDSVTSLERVAGPRDMRDFVTGLGSFVKNEDITTLLTGTTNVSLDKEPLAGLHTSTLADTMISLRYVEMIGEMRRLLAVVKARGSAHDPTIREFTIDGRGLHIGAPTAERAPAGGGRTGTPGRAGADQDRSGSVTLDIA